MRVVVNGEPREVQPGTAVGDLVREVTEARRGVAVAVNGEVVRRSAWDECELEDGDRVEVVAAVQGGSV